MGSHLPTRDAPRLRPSARLAIDARLRAYRGGGIAEHVSRLLAGLAEIQAGPEILVLEHRRAAFGPSWRRPWARPLPNIGRGRTAEGLAATHLWTPPHHRWEDLCLPLELGHRRLDLLHCPDMVIPRAWRGAAVLTVHDLAFLSHPEWLTAESRRYYGAVRRSLTRAGAIIAVSAYTRRSVLERTGLGPERVVVVPNAVHPRFLAPGDPAGDAAVARRLGLPGPFLLFVSTIEPRKNVGVLLRALRRLLDEGRDLSLALAGADGWHSAEVYELARTLRLSDRARFLGYVAEADLPALYRQATLLAHPALDEGFGLPPLEAMAAGTPVVVADAGSLPEVVGEAGLRVPAEDPAAWATALAAVVDQPALSFELVERGRAQAAAFTLRRMAEATLAVYRSVLDESPGAGDR